nr:hypothetical protein [Micromonospora sp. DSM 115978]
MSPRVAVERLVARGDWTAEHWPRERLSADLERLARRYDELARDSECVTIDADAPADAVLAEVLGHVRGLADASRTATAPSPRRVVTAAAPRGRRRRTLLAVADGSSANGATSTAALSALASLGDR